MCVLASATVVYVLFVRTTLLLLVCLALAAGASDRMESTLVGPYKAGGQNWTADGHAVICDTAEPVSRLVKRCR